MKKSPITPERLAAVNVVLEKLSWWSKFEVRGNKVFLVSDMPVRGRAYHKENMIASTSHGNYPKFDTGMHGLSGTQTVIMMQLWRWLIDRPRIPLDRMRGSFSKFRELGVPADILDNTDYGDPEKTKCVLCGDMEHSGEDWWSLDDVDGPCCQYGRCIKEKEQPI